MSTRDRRLQWIVRWGFILIWCSGLALQPTTARATAKAEVEYAKGIVAYRGGNYSNALEHFKTTAALEPENPYTQFHLGLSHYRLGAFQEATEALEIALDVPARNPKYLQLKPYIRYHLGLALYKLERYQEAQREFEEFLKDVSPDAPGARDARQNLKIISRLNFIDQPKEKKRRVQLGGAIGFQYDDNVVLESNDEVVDFGDAADGRTVFAFAGRLLPVRTSSWLAGAEYSLFQSLHFDLTEFDTQRHTGRLFAGWKRTPVTLHVAADYTYTLLDNDKFSRQVTVEPRAIVQQTDALSAEVSVRYRASDFYNQFIPPEQHDVRDRDGWTLQTGFDQYLAFNVKRSRARLSYHYEAGRNDGTDWEYDGHRVGVGLETPLWWNVMAYLDGSYLRRDYLHRNSFDADPLGVLTAADRRERLDDRFIGSVELERSLGGRLIFIDLVLSAGFLHVSNLSNIDFYEYRRNIVTVRFAGRY